MGKRILIIDDDERICAILAQRLAQEGFSCVTANRGKEALQHFYKDNFSLIISDIKMPEMDGIDLLGEVRALDQNMLVILITAYPEVDMAVKAMHMGAYDFIIKPFDLDLMVFSVRKALEKKGLEEQIEAYHQKLEKLVEERTAELRYAYRVLKKNHFDSVRVLIGAIDAKDPYTRGHSDRVRRMSLEIGMRLGFAKERMEGLEYGALLHDLGMLGIKDEVLRKQGPLSPEEYQHIQEHPMIGVRIIAGIDFFKNKIPMIRHHHERFDGNGYPDRLAGEEIPVEARIIAISDAFDAMTTIRPYRTRMTLEDALAEMNNGKGNQFDPNILDIFLNGELYHLSLKYSIGNKDILPSASPSGFLQQQSLCE